MVECLRRLPVHSGACSASLTRGFCELGEAKAAVAKLQFFTAGLHLAPSLRFTSAGRRLWVHGIITGSSKCQRNLRLPVIAHFVSFSIRVFGCDRQVLPGHTATVNSVCQLPRVGGEKCCLLQDATCRICKSSVSFNTPHSNCSAAEVGYRVLLPAEFCGCM